MQTVSGQYITHNTATTSTTWTSRRTPISRRSLPNKGETLSERRTQPLLLRAVEPDPREFDTSRTHVPGHRIWEYEVPWESQTVNRPGYLFLGAMDERDTAKPPRDFYVYFLPPFSTANRTTTRSRMRSSSDSPSSDADFDELLRRYAGARAMELSSASHRDRYRAKANEAGKLLPNGSTTLRGSVGGSPPGRNGDRYARR